MNEHEINSNNRLIAEFMGYKFGVHTFFLDEGDEYNYKYKPYNNGIVYKDNLPESTKTHKYKYGYDESLDYGLKYHYSYDSLMPVVKKIHVMYEDLYKKSIIEKIPISYDIETTYADVICRHVTTDIEHLYRLVINFIKWHNIKIWEKEK